MTILVLRRYAERLFGSPVLGQVVYTDRLDEHFDWESWKVVHLDDMNVVFERCSDVRIKSADEAWRDKVRKANSGGHHGSHY